MLDAVPNATLTFYPGFGPALRFSSLLGNQTFGIMYYCMKNKSQALVLFIETKSKALKLSTGLSLEYNHRF